MSDEADLWSDISNRSNNRRKERVQKGFLSDSTYFRLSSVSGSISDRLTYEADSRRDASHSVEYDRQGDNPNLKRGLNFPELLPWRNPNLASYDLQRVFQYNEDQISLSVERTLLESGITTEDPLYDIIHNGLQSEKMHADNLAAAEHFMDDYNKKYEKPSDKLSAKVSSVPSAATTVSTAPEKPSWMDG